VVPAAMSNALTAHSVHAKPLTPGESILVAVKDQVGNAAVAGAAMRLVPWRYQTRKATRAVKTPSVRGLTSLLRSFRQTFLVA